MPCRTLSGDKNDFKPPRSPWGGDSELRFFCSRFDWGMFKGQGALLTEGDQKSIFNASDTQGGRVRW